MLHLPDLVRKGRGGFTLIELLIVIAIILILISIALPNFLEAQIRARVTKAKAEIRSLQTCFESYNQDWKVYPRGCITGHPVKCSHNWGFVAENLTTPIKYINAIVDDLFAVNYAVGGIMGQVPEGHPYAKYRTTRRLVWNALNPNEAPKAPVPKDKIAPPWHLYDSANPAVYKNKQYLIASLGPDHIEDMIPQYTFSGGYTVNNEFYSPTNGTNSKGDLAFVGP